MSVYPFIEAEKFAERNVSKACTLLEVSHSADSVWHTHVPSARTISDTRLGDASVEIHRTSRRTYGAPRATAQLRRHGIRVGRKRVARLMVRRGLVGRGKRRWTKTTIPDPLARVSAVDRVGRAFDSGACALDRVYVGDITYVRTHEGWLYVATAIDLASRRVVGFAMADHMRASLVCDALAMAIELRHPAPGLIFHSDRGSQYTSREIRVLLEAHGAVQSLSRPRQCWDSAVAESFFATLKEEPVHCQTLPTRDAARRAIFEFVEVFYNRSRLHSTLNYRTPVEYEEERRNPGKTQAAESTCPSNPGKARRRPSMRGCGRLAILSAWPLHESTTRPSEARRSSPESDSQTDSQRQPNRWVRAVVGGSRRSVSCSRNDSQECRFRRRG